MTRQVRDFFILDRQPKASSDADLVARCLDGDNQAWNTLVEKYKDLVWSVPLKYRMGPEDCADIFQAVWLDLFSDLKSLRYVGALRSWLVTTASHKCYHWKTRQQSLTRITGEVESEPEDNFSLIELRLQAEREQLLREALAELSPRCRELVRMLFFEQPPRAYDEVATTLGLAVGSIGFIRGRCLKKLRDWLTEKKF